jgi:hypothetical protein
MPKHSAAATAASTAPDLLLILQQVKISRLVAVRMAELDAIAANLP